MGDAGRRALIDELDRAFLEFADFVREIPREMYDTAVPGEEGSVRAILRHVVEAGYGHVTQMAPTVGGVEVARRFPSPVLLDDPESWVAALMNVGRYARAVLANVEDAALERRFKSRWGQDYDGEQMLEHATCHPGRHARQLRRFFDGEL
jgi:hypothetical protein